MRPMSRILHAPLSTRRTLLIGTAALLALPATAATKKAGGAKPQPPEVWPRASQVPGGIARLSLGPRVNRLL